MSTVKDLRMKAKEQGLCGYSTMNRRQLEQLMKGEKVVKYRKNQSHAETQTEDLPKCHDCEEILACHRCFLLDFTDKMLMKSERRNILVENDIKINMDTGEVLGPVVSSTREVWMNKQR